MGASASILQQLRSHVVQGEGFLKNKPISLLTAHLMSSGALLTTTLSTNPGFDKTGTNFTTLSWAAAKVVQAGLDLQVPDDYDKAKDHLKLKIKCSMAGSTDTPTIDAVAYKDSAPTTDLDPTISVAASDSLQWLEIDLSGNSLAAGDAITIGIFPAAHGTDALNVYAMKLEYRSTLVYASREVSR